MIFALSALSSFSMMFCSITQWGMLPDTVEYGQWKTGVRSEGIPFAFFSFMQKSGMALLLVLLLLLCIKPDMKPILS